MSVGRNQRNNADYFSHDADASADEKIVYLESIFGHTGYALYFKFLECMTRAENFMIKWDDIKKAVYAAKFSVSVTEIDQFVTECCRDEIKAFELQNGYMYSPGLLKRFEGLIAKREYNRQKYQEQKQEDKIQQQKKQFQKQKGHSKGKESKGNNIKETAENLYTEYLKLISPKNKSKPRAIHNLIEHHLKQHDPTSLSQSIKNYAKNIPNDPQYRKDPANFFGANDKYFITYLPENYVPDAQPQGYKPKPQRPVEDDFK